jgi:hypothetical protein
VNLHWRDMAVVMMVVGAGCAAIYASLARTLRRTIAERQRETERQLSALSTTVKTLQECVAELGQIQKACTQGSDVAVGPATEHEAGGKQDTPKPETLAVITAAATAFLGHKARIHSAQLLPTARDGGVWAQQGRMSVQTSHDPRSRR